MLCSPQVPHAKDALNVLSVLRRTVRSGEQSIGTRPPSTAYEKSAT